MKRSKIHSEAGKDQVPRLPRDFRLADVSRSLGVPLSTQKGKGRRGPPRAYRVAELSRSLGIPRSTLYRLIKEGQLRAVRYSQHGVIVLEEDLSDFLARRRTARS